MIITSLLDTDLYKITQQSVALFGRYAGIDYQNVEARYAFINRGQTQFPEGFASKLQAEINCLADLSLINNEHDWLINHCPFIKPAFLDWLKSFRFDPIKEVDIQQVGGELSLTIKGPWYRTILYEVPLMAIMSELYFREKGLSPDSEWKNRCLNKARNLESYDVNVADFGTRRRFSLEVHDQVVQIMKDNCSTFSGSSNIGLAMKYGIKPIGTHAHELFMFHAALFGYRFANHHSLQAWVDEYQGDLGIALTDTFTTDVFFRDFSKVFAKLFDGCRHDSNSAIKFAEKAITYYESMDIDPLTKTIVFSDALTDDKAIKIKRWCEGKIKCSFGIGTSFTNSCGHTPLNMVIKMVGVEYKGRYYPTVKLSDVPGKETGDPKEIELCKRILGIRSS
ncbi:hypothetical protein LCGC14_1661950 [marine sediment metagenome]|uniref:nicotinate phosphoribosyltransferase n=1 Tax=marine sediment metagenome TaxID=412755 RepID=A0A0F9HTT7_9ZZZZ